MVLEITASFKFERGLWPLSLKLGGGGGVSTPSAPPLMEDQLTQKCVQTSFILIVSSSILNLYIYSPKSKFSKMNHGNHTVLLISNLESTISLTVMQNHTRLIGFGAYDSEGMKFGISPMYSAKLGLTTGQCFIATSCFLTRL